MLEDYHPCLQTDCTGLKGLRIRAQLLPCPPPPPSFDVPMQGVR